MISVCSELQKNTLHLRSQGLTKMPENIAVLCDAVQSRRSVTTFERNTLSYHGNLVITEGLGFSETSVTFYQFTRRRIKEKTSSYEPEALKLRIH